MEGASIYTFDSTETSNIDSNHFNPSKQLTENEVQWRLSKYV